MKRLTITVEYDDGIANQQNGWPPVPSRVVMLATQAANDAGFLFEALTSDEFYGDKVPCRVTYTHDGVMVSERTYALSDLHTD